MDSVTQIALGGAVGYAVLGKQLGRRAVLYGAVLGTLPDLDVFIPYDGPVESFTYHRSVTHSLVVHLLASPLIAWLLMKINAMKSSVHSNINRTRWFCAVFLCLATHTLLDSLTVYGTQLLWPLTDYPFGVSNLFIIDPLVTLPLLIGLILVLLPRTLLEKAPRFNQIGLIVSSAYIVWSYGAKLYIDNKVELAMAQNNIQSTVYISTPAPFTTLLWRIVALTEDGYYEAYASVFDTPEEVSLDFYPTSPELLAGIEDDWDVSRLRWFTKGAYSVRAKDNKIAMSDLRMGLECAYVFNFIVGEITEDGAKAIPATTYRQRPNFDGLGAVFSRITDSSVSLAPSQQTLSEC